MTERDPINPSYYQGFSNGAQVIDISEHLTSNGGQALQYVARSCRLDGNNKGDVVENLEKAKWFLDREIERVEHHARHNETPVRVKRLQEGLSHAAIEIQERINRMHDKASRDPFVWRATHEFNTEEDRATR